MDATNSGKSTQRPTGGASYTGGAMMTTQHFNATVTAEIQRMMREAQQLVDAQEAEASAWIDTMLSPEADKLFQHKPLGRAWERIMEDSQ